MDLHNAIFKSPQMGFGAPYFDLWISIIRVMDLHDSIMDLHNFEVWISMSWYMELHNYK